MSTKRLKVIRAAIRSRSEAETLLGCIRTLTIERNALQAEREHKLKQVDDGFAPKLDLIARELENHAELLRGWAEENPSEFAGKKSLELTHGLMGWRVGQPTLKTLSGWTWDRVLEKLVGPYEGFVRRKAEVDKAGLLAQRDALGAAELRALGVRVVQEEPFFVEPKLEEPTETRIKGAA